jgi:hypothetical protein
MAAGVKIVGISGHRYLKEKHKGEGIPQNTRIYNNVFSNYLGTIGRRLKFLTA